ncbi:hypothetical protein GCM10029992_27700 [Glycomyces albus]
MPYRRNGSADTAKLSEECDISVTVTRYRRGVLTSVQLDAYLERIGLRTPRRPSLRTLTALHRAHIEAIPYESLDIHLGMPIRLERDALFDKLVTRRRGGFCYEQNGVLAHALEALGFEVVRLRGAVDRSARGDGEWFNHMPLLVRLRQGDFLADAGLGVGFNEPLPLDEGSGGSARSTSACAASTTACGAARSTPRAGPDLRLRPVPQACRGVRAEVPRAADLPGVGVRQDHDRAAARVRPDDRAARALLIVYDPDLPDGKTTETLADRDRFTSLLTGEFGLNLSEDETGVLWERAGEQHERHLAEQDAVPMHGSQASP